MIRKFPLAVLMAIPILLSSPAKAQQQPTQLPGLKDWFLATGNWEKDPQLYVLEMGTGADTIVMIHGGWGSEHSGLIPAVRSLANKYHFVFYDQRGSLRSPFPDSLISLENHIEDLELLRKELKIDKLNLVGHSMGSFLASAYASKYPNRIKRLVLLAPAGLKSQLSKEENELLGKEEAKLQKFRTRPAVEQEMNKLNLNRTSPPLSSQEQTAKFRISLFGRLMLFDPSKWNQLMGGRGMDRLHLYQIIANSYPKEGFNYVEDFKKDNYPITIITGDHDFLDFGNGLHKKWASENPRIKFTAVKDAGHFLWVDQPEEVAKLIDLEFKVPNPQTR